MGAGNLLRPEQNKEALRASSLQGSGPAIHPLPLDPSAPGSRRLLLGPRPSAPQFSALPTGTEFQRWPFCLSSLQTAACGASLPPQPRKSTALV